MISKYVAEALKRARYERLEDETFVATVKGLRGVIAIGNDREACREQLAEVIEGWILVRVAHHLPIPKLGGVSIRVKRAG